MDWIYYFLLLVTLLLGLFLTVLTLPGLWLMLGAAAAYAWITGGIHIGVWSLVILLLLALAAEGAEFLAGSAGAQKAGGSKRAMIGAIVGALLGGFFLTFLVPLPILGTIVGVCLGAFLGAAAAQITKAGDVAHSMRVGVGAAKGRFVGIVVKLAFGIVMLLIAAFAALPLGAAPPPAPTTVPTTQPTPTPTPSILPARGDLSLIRVHPRSSAVPLPLTHGLASMNRSAFLAVTHT